VWEENHPEPETWDLDAPGTVTSLKEGSFLLGAHHVAASFGNVNVVLV